MHLFPDLKALIFVCNWEVTVHLHQGVGHYCLLVIQLVEGILVYYRQYISIDQCYISVPNNVFV